MSKYNANRENQVALLIITDGKKWHYLIIKKLPALLRVVSFLYLTLLYIYILRGAFYYCLNCFDSYITPKKLKSIMRYVKLMIVVLYQCLKKITKYLNTTMDKSP